MKNLILLLVMCLAVVQPAGAQDWKSFTTTFNTGSKGHLAIAFDNNDSLCVAYRNGIFLRVAKYTGSGWNNMDPFGAFNTVDPYWISLKFNSNNIPYVCFLHPGVQMNVMECINGTWTSLGGSNGVTTATISNPQFVFGPNDTLFACYIDPGSNNYALPFVKKYNRSTDTWVGTATITSNKSEPLRLTTDSSKTPYIAYRDNTQNAQIVVKKYDGNTNSWVNIGSASGISHKANTGLAIAFDSKDSLYVAYGDNTVSNKLIVLKNRGNTWVVVGDSLGNSAGSAEDISMMADDDGNIYVCYIDGANNTDPTVKKYDGSSWTTVGSEGFASANSISEFGALAMDSMKNLYLASQRTSTSIEISRYREKTTCRSNNPTSGPYYWDNGDPDDVTNAVIAAFNADPGSFTCNDLILDHYLDVPSSSTYTVHGDIIDNFSNGFDGNGTVILTKDDTTTLKGIYDLESKLIVEEGTTLFLDNNTTLNIKNELELAGDLSMHDNATLDISSGKLLLNGTTAQTLNLGQTTHKFVTVDTMELDNSAGASFGNGVIYIRSEYQPTSGTLASSNRLRLLSDASGSARIAAGSSSGGYITGNIVGRLYIPGGRRAFRFLSHAAIDTKPLNQLTDNIDITGQGGSTNGFTTTLSNAPSAFYFDVNTGDNSTAGNNPGWKAFTSATTTSWAKGQVMRVLIRGAKGEGLTTTTYTPSAVTLDMYEQVNQGDQTVTLTKGANTNFVLVGNPFPSQVQLNTVARGSNVGANFYIWDPSQGVRGGYTSHMFSSSYVLPQWGAFVTTVSANTNNTMVFEEADKTDGTPASQFKVTGSNHLLELSIDDTAYHWDRLLLSFDQDGYAVQDKLDAVKLNNPGLDFYTVSKDGTDLSIDVRPMQDKEIIPIGVDVWHNGGDGTFTFSAKELNLSAGDQLIFYDKYLNQQEPITDTFSYTFTVSSADSMSGGKHRFQIGVSTPTAIASAPSSTQAGQVQVYPNPAQDEVNVVFKQVAGKATLALSSVTGKVIYKKAVQEGTGRETIQLTELPPGIYIVELKGQNISYTQKLIKQ